MLYCTYDEYQAADGTVPEAAFGVLCSRASRLIDSATFGRAETHAAECKEDDEYLIKFNEILDDFFADLLGEDYDQRLGIDVDDLEDLMQLLADFNAAADPEALERMAALQPIDREAMKDAKSSIPAPIPMPMNREQRRAARRAKA